MKTQDIHTQVANQIIHLMKCHGIAWAQRWQRARPASNGITGHVYRGSNVFTTNLWLMLNEQADPRFIPRSYLFNRKEPEKNVGSVRKGCKAIPIFYFDRFKKEKPDGSEETIGFAKTFYVWHVSQIDNLDKSKLVDPSPDPAPIDPVSPDPRLEAWIANTKAEIRHGKVDAAYWPTMDFIGMPSRDSFYSSEFYYGTLLHELVHWTGAPHRLNRDKQYHTTEGRAFEELVAELGAVMLGMELGVQTQPRSDNAAYIKGWITQLTDRPKAIFEAASKAGAAQTYLAELQQKQITEGIAAE